MDSISTLTCHLSNLQHVPPHGHDTRRMGQLFGECQVQLANRRQASALEPPTQYQSVANRQHTDPPARVRHGVRLGSSVHIRWRQRGLAPAGGVQVSLVCLGNMFISWLTIGFPSFPYYRSVASCIAATSHVDCLRNRIPESSWQANNHVDERGDGCARSAPAHSKVHPHRSYQRNCQTDGIYALRLLLTGIDFLVTVFVFNSLVISQVLSIFSKTTVLALFYVFFL